MKQPPFYFITIKLWVHVLENFAAYISNLFEFSLILNGLKFQNILYLNVTDPRFVMEAEMISVHVDLIQKT